MNDMFSFESAAWELAFAKIPGHGAISAVRLLTLLEGEEEESVDEAFLALREKDILPDVSVLPMDFGTGETESRLRAERAAAMEDTLLENFPEDDPLGLYLAEMAAIPVCGDEELLAQEAVETGHSMDICTRLSELSLAAVVELAKEYTGRGVLLLDLIQEGSLGLWDGILAYDGSCPFGPYRDRAVRFAMAEAVVRQARIGGVGQKMQKALEAYQSTDRQLLTKLGHNPSLAEIAVEMGITPEQAEVYRDMLDTARNVARAKAEPAQRQPEEDQAVEDTAYFQSRQRVDELLSGLDEKQALLLRLRFGLDGAQPLSVEQAARKLGMTVLETQREELAALNKLRQ